jgi:acetyl esterase/lipase
LNPRQVPVDAPALTLDYGPDPAQVLDVYRPAGWQPTDSRPAIVFVHGGGWASGWRGDLAPNIKAQLTRGWVVVSIDYRLSDRVDWPSPVQDVDRAMRYVRANARLLGVNPDFIVSSGHSAGAHLALAQALGGGNPAFVDPTLPADLAAVSSRPTSVVSMSAPVDLGLWIEQDWDGGSHVLNLLLGCDNTLWDVLTCTPEQLESASVVGLLDQGDPAVLIVHGLNDDVVLPVQGFTLYSRARELGMNDRVWFDIVDTGRGDQRGHFNDYALNQKALEQFLDLSVMGRLGA